MQMKKIVLLCFLTFYSIYAIAQKNWFKQKLTNRLTVNFPSAPAKTAGTTFALKDSTNTVYTATYSLIAQNLKIDGKAFGKLTTTNEFTSDFLSSLQATLPQYNLEEIRIKREKNYVSYFTEGKDEAEKKSIFMHIIFIDGIYYSLSCILPDGQNPQKKDIFLSSFQLAK